MIITLIAMFTIGQASLSYVSQYHYLNEIRHYYEKEIRLQLVKGKQESASEAGIRGEATMNLFPELQQRIEQ